MSLELYEPHLKAVMAAGDLDLLQHIEEEGYKQIALMYPEDAWAPSYPLRRLLEKREWAENIRLARKETMRVAAGYSLDAVKQQAGIALQERLFGSQLDQTRRTLRVGSEDRVWEATEMAKVTQGQGNQSPLDITKSFLEQMAEVERNTKLSNDERERRMEFLSVALQAQLKK